MSGPVTKLIARGAAVSAVVVVVVVLVSGGGSSRSPVRPHWASWRARLVVLATAGIGVAALDPVLAALGSFGALADSWIFMGSLLATISMARGHTEFWLLWIAVDAVGVPLLLRAHYYPSAVLYLIYGGFCIWGFVVWHRTQRAGGRRPMAASSEVPPHNVTAVGAR